VLLTETSRETAYLTPWLCASSQVPKLYLAHWIARRALTQQDVMQCFQNSSAAAIEGSKELLLRLLPIEEKYDIGVELCKGEPPGCKAQPWVQVA